MYRSILKKNLMMLFSILLWSQAKAEYTFSWEPYITCNDGAAVIDVRRELNNKFEDIIEQVVVRDRGVVNYFKSAMPDLKSGSPYAPSVYNDKGEAIFSLHSDFNGHSWSERKTYSQNSLYKNLSNGQNENIRLIVTRIEKGIELEFISTLSNRPLMNWYFENCTRLNAGYGQSDPLEFWYADHD